MTTLWTDKYVEYMVHITVWLSQIDGSKWLENEGKTEEIPINVFTESQERSLVRMEKHSKYSLNNGDI